MEITAKVSLTNGKHIGDKNIDKILARDTRENTSLYEGGTLVKGYFCRYKAVKEEEGYIFREVKFNTGINGHHPTLRSLILNTLIDHGHNIKVEIDV